MRAGTSFVFVGQGGGVVNIPGSVLGSGPGVETYWMRKPPPDPVSTTISATTNVTMALPAASAAVRFLRARARRSCSRRARRASSRRLLSAIRAAYGRPEREVQPLQGEWMKLPKFEFPSDPMQGISRARGVPGWAGGCRRRCEHPRPRSGRRRGSSTTTSRPDSRPGRWRSCHRPVEPCRGCSLSGLRLWHERSDLTRGARIGNVFDAQTSSVPRREHECGVTVVHRECPADLASVRVAVRGEVPSAFLAEFSGSLNSESTLGVRRRLPWSIAHIHPNGSRR